MDKQSTLNSINPDKYSQQAHSISDEMTKQKQFIDELKQQEQDAVDSLDIEEASLMLSEGYRSGKNAEERKAWLATQKTKDQGYSAALGRLNHIRTRLASANSKYESLTRQYQLARDDLRSANAKLEFLAS